MTNTRSYQPDVCATFMRSADQWGGFSNMAGGYPILVNQHIVRSNEHFYQAMRFPHLAGFQQEILDEKSPMFAKRKAYERIAETRDDWQQMNIGLMKFGLRLKIGHNHVRMSMLYRETNGRPIVELSHRDEFWGAKPQKDGSLIGVNALGRLHMGLRAELELAPDLGLNYIESPPITDFTLCGESIADWRRPARSRVLNAHYGGKNQSGAIYIGRPSEWGNPFQIGPDGDRAEVIGKYIAYLHEHPELVDKARRELSGKDLVCWCCPAGCHGDVLADIASGLPLPPIPEPRSAPQTAFNF